MLTSIKDSDSILYKNPELVKIFIKLLPFSRFNIKNFNDAIKSSEQIVRVFISFQIGHKIPYQTLEIVEQLQRNILNNIHSMVHSFPSSEISDYRFNSYIKILQQILQKIIDDIKLLYEEYYNKNGPDIYNPPPCIYSGEWDNPINSKEYNKYWNYYF